MLYHEKYPGKKLEMQNKGLIQLAWLSIHYSFLLQCVILGKLFQFDASLLFFYFVVYFY